MTSLLSVHIENIDDYTSAYNSKRLNPDLLAYILEENKGIPFHYDIQIKVSSSKPFSKKEQINFIDILRSNLGEDIKESYLELKLTYIRAIILSLIGILAILLSYLFSTPELFSEVLLIIGWVGVWEACYIFLFDNMQRRIKIKRFKRLVNAKVSFDEKI